MRIEDQLAALTVDAPASLARSTLIEAGAADLVATTDSPFGPLWVAWSKRGVTGLTPRFACDDIDSFLDHHRRGAYAAGALPSDLADLIGRAVSEGETQAVPVDMSGIAPFQRSVLAATASIRHGDVRPYGWIAEEIGNPGAVRAVGTALGRNPIPLIVPCHRVVRSDGSIGNYAFGTEMKRQLLVREGAILA